MLTGPKKGIKNAMNERQQILYMQTRIIRLASEKWNMPIEKIAELFAEYDVLQYIEDGFGIFHVEGDMAVLEDIAAYLQNKGVACDARIER